MRPKNLVEITHLLIDYRDVARYSWNRIVSASNRKVKHASDDYFEAWENYNNVLFESLVLDQLDIDHVDKEILNKNSSVRKPMDYIQVKTDDLEMVKIMINNPREGDGNGYWDYPIQNVKGVDYSASFIDFFDWEHLKMRDFNFVLVRLDEFKIAPEINGRFALLETGKCRFFLTP